MKTLCALFCALALLGCGKDTYHPIYYPDKSNLNVGIHGPIFESLEFARAWIRETSEKRRDANWDYEIGKNFKEWFGGPDGVGIYEETLR